jgi:hypothetical protein
MDRKKEKIRQEAKCVLRTGKFIYTIHNARLSAVILTSCFSFQFY